MQKVRWAVVGTSDFALNWIARGIKLGHNSTLAAIVSRDARRAVDAARRLEAPLHYTSIEQIDPNKVDGVFIVTPNTQHAPLAVVAAQRGLHVIVEKPMAPTVEACRTMIKVADEEGVTLAVAHCMEWVPPIVKARELVRNGALGMLVNASFKLSFNSPPAGVWRQDDATKVGGGPLHDVGVHSIDAIQQVMGPVERVAAFLDHHVHDYNAEDTVTLLLRFASGAHGTVEAHFNCEQNSFEIQGTYGVLRSNHWVGRDFSGKLYLDLDGKITSFDLERCNVYVSQIEHVSASILGGEKLLISGERGMRNIAVIEAAIESAKTDTIIEVNI